MIVRHKKRNTYYDVVGEGILQNSGSIDIAENDVLVIYRSKKDGQLWIRPKDQFFDGRFEILDENKIDIEDPGPRQDHLMVGLALHQDEESEK